MRFNKLDNKGYLIIEIILASVIAFAVMYFLLEITFNLKSKNDDLYKEISFVSDKNIITKTVMDDVNSMQVSKLDFGCTDNKIQCVDIVYNVSVDNLEVSQISKRFEINKSTKKVIYGTYNSETLSYDKDDYYFEKTVSDDLDFSNVGIDNECFGSNVLNSESSDGVYLCSSVDDDSDILNTNGLFTIKFNATSKFLDKDYGINITIPYNNLEVSFDVPKCFDTNQTVPEEPVLADGMIPIYWDSDGVIKKADVNNLDNNWYDYANGKWANAVLVNNNRSTYISSSFDTVINVDDIVSYYVWIPRYSYRLFEVSSSSSLEQTCISFESKSDVKKEGSNVGELYTHPSFTFDGNELSGIWVSKFRTTSWVENGSYDFSSPKAVVSLARSPVLISRAYYISSLFSEYLTDTGRSNSDVHMIKNTDWGAISYLTYSYFGVCNDGVCSELETNSNDKNNNYKNNVKQSTTGTVYGIYNMKSYNSEFVMGNFGNIVGHQFNSPNSSTDANYNYSNFKGIMYTTNEIDYYKNNVSLDTICTRDSDNPYKAVNCYYEGVKDEKGKYLGVYGEPVDFPDAKYYDLYEIYDEEGNVDNSKRYILGDATYEVMNLSNVSGLTWLSNFSSKQGFFTWYVRGNNNSILYFNTSYGSSNSSYFRSVIVEK